MAGQAAHLAGAAPKHFSPLLQPKQETCPGAQQIHRKGRATQRWGNGHQLQDLPNLKAQPSPAEKAAWEGKGFSGEKKLHLG